ncbi:MAG TPA: toxin-antitoxin system HicB family antitoxin [Pseudonocardiaceae bacterium]|nr:toxin-antitoxin system HicB family antitoxin [Pseudonocardiaceae bacterium]
MTLRFPDDLDAELRAAADAAHVSINSFVVEAIKERLESLHHESVIAIARDVIGRDAEILDRLATA